ncbi:MAG: SUMF1/EgtB/PvdO family nonheme iron enzyme [Planctomycetes bacterium]|nr:SUMF1/EgtB/PvdO family nonheme iron enzyme [Planctomycetota bacterium]
MRIPSLVTLPLLCTVANAQQHAPRVNDLQITPGEPPAVTFAISWPNSWRNDRNHDGAWIILRGPDPRRGPLRLQADGHTADGKIPGTLEVADDRLGVFLFPATNHRGDVTFQVRLQLDEPAPPTITAWTLDMVFIPSGPFELGDNDPATLRLGAFHHLDDSGKPAVVSIRDERELTIARNGDLWYETDRNRYRGDQGGPLPAAWPKGTAAFWLMKHELTQGQYAAFLSAQPAEWQPRRAPLERKGEETDTCSITREGDRFVAAAPDRPCNFVSWDDTAALFDWLALRPITEFEFEKAARGPTRPMPGDFPWGTASAEALKRHVLKSRDLAAATIADEATLTDATRAQLGASFYWVMDLAGSVWERTISAGDPIGRAFTGSHGDGVLSADGGATNADWPRAKPKGDLAPGIGFRGGAEYFGARDATNPQSLVAVRTYAGWGGAERYKTYSARAGRMAR